MKKKSVGLNAILSVLKVLLNVVFPLLTFPYASRVLLAENLGKVNYTKSIVDYFALLASLGLSVYAVREGVRFKNDKEKMKQFSSEIITTNLITTLCAYLLLAIALIIVPKLYNYRVLIMIQSLVIIFTTVGVDWINVIFEDYLYILIRSLVVQVIFVICLFVFVRDSNDYYIYAFLCTMNTGMISILNIVHVRKYCKIRITKNLQFFKHIRSLFVFFTSNLATTIYLSSDTTMLGWMVGDYYAGIYALAVKIYSMIKTLLNAVYSVAIPRLSTYIYENKVDEYRKLLTDIISCLLLLGLPSVVLLWQLAKSIVLIVAGEEFLDAVVALQILSVSIIFAVASGILVNCLNVTLNREMVSLKATIAGALVNIFLNIFMIPLSNQNGAATTTAIAEFVVAAICFFNYKDISRYIDFEELKKQFKDAIVGCIILAIICNLTKRLLVNDVCKVIVVSGIGACVYCICLILMKNTYMQKVLSEIEQRF